MARDPEIIFPSDKDKGRKNFLVLIVFLFIQLFSTVAVAGGGEGKLNKDHKNSASKNAFFDCSVSVSLSPSTICQGQVSTVSAILGVNLVATSYTWTVPAGVPDPGSVSSFTTAIAGQYSVTVSGTDGI